MSVLDRNTEYTVRNYTGSPVAVSTRTGSYLIPGGSRDNPVEFPMTLAELAYVNSVSNVFKIGMLFFDEQFESDLYESLKIRDWHDILRLDEIDDIILHPTTEKLERIIKIQNPTYFERIYGEYIGLKNAGMPISGSVDQVMKLRKNEFRKGSVRSEIKVRTVEPSADQINAQNDKIAEMQKQIEQLTALLAQQQAAPATATAEAADKPAVQKSTKSTRGVKQKEE